MKPNRQYIAVKIDKAQQAIKRERIVLGGAGYLGVRHSENQDYKGKGIILSGVQPGSPAEKAGFKAKDVILSINELPVNTFEELVEAVAKYQPEEVVRIEHLNALLMSGEPQLKLVTLGQKKIDLENPAMLRDLRHNLQFGEIIEIGEDVAIEFPHAKIGDTLIFHHAVEHKARTEGDVTYNDFHLVDVDAGGNEIRIIHKDFEILGVLKIRKSGPVIIPDPKYIFCHQQIMRASVQKDKKSGLWLPEQWEKSILEYQEQLDELQAQLTEITSSTVLSEKTNQKNFLRKEEIAVTINMLKKEKTRISRKMHQKRLVETTVLFCNPKSQKELGYHLEAGDKLVVDYYSLYPLDIQGVFFSLARVGSIEGAILQKPLPFKKIKSTKKSNTMSNPLFVPLHDRVILKMHEAEVITESGLFVPDVAQQIPGRGLVVACGPGLPDKPMQAKEGDIVLLSKFAGTDVNYEGTDYRFIREDDILTTLNGEEAAKAISDNERVLAQKELLAKQRNEEIREKTGNDSGTAQTLENKLAKA
jgi:chaperonin GroES